MSGLDHFLLFDDWENHLSGLLQSVLPISISGHSTIWLDQGGVSEEKSCFRFKNMWLKVEGFKDLIKNWWLGHRFNASSNFILASKLKALKMDLKT